MKFRWGGLGGGRAKASPQEIQGGVGGRSSPHHAMGASGGGGVYIILYLDSCEWLDKVNETFLEHLQNVSKLFHPLCLAIYLPIHHYGIHSSGGPPKAAPPP